MRNLNLLIGLFLSGILFAQEQDSLQNETIYSKSIGREDIQKLTNFVAQNLEFPHELEYDTISRTLRFTVEFIVDEEGNVINHSIVRRSEECKICEANILKVFRKAPRLNPVYMDDRKVKVKFQLPVAIQIL